jgi:hypothetical protein
VNRQQRRAAARRHKSGTLEDFVREAARIADQMLDAHGEVPPFWLVDTPEGTAMVGTDMDDDESKDAVAQRMREFMREHRATRYVFVAESWTCEPVRRMEQLSDGEVSNEFTTDVPSSPIQAWGVRGKDGRLYVSNAADVTGGGRSGKSWSEVVKKNTEEVEGFEVITGAEAEQLLADVQAEIEWLKQGDGRPRTHPRRREIVLLAAEDHTRALAGMRDIIRSEGGKPRMSALEINEDHQPSGRFADLLREHVVH